MSKAVECIRCHAQMEVGHVLDATHSGYQQQNECMLKCARKLLDTADIVIALGKVWKRRNRR